MKATIDLKEDAVYIVKEGKLVPVDKPASGFGTQEIHWQDGKILQHKVSYTKR